MSCVEPGGNTKHLHRTRDILISDSFFLFGESSVGFCEPCENIHKISTFFICHHNCSDSLYRKCLQIKEGQLCDSLIFNGYQ